MRNSKAKEQLIAIVTLSSVFIFIIYLKMNPEISENTFSTEQHINTMVNDVVENTTDSESEDKLDNIKNQESIDTIEDNSIIVFTENELDRAKAYQDRNWKADGTINIAAWEYILNNPNFRQEKETDSNIDVVDIVK
tara:strand:+ start:182 stop:592 length:411 start_codon:yes stop_codon:yes gene_type:complete